MADFGVPEVPKLHTLSRTLYDNKVYPEACNHPPCCWAINVCFHVQGLPDIEEVRKFFCTKLCTYTKLCSVVQPEDGAWFPTVLDPAYHVVLQDPASTQDAMDKLLNTPLDMGKPLWRVHLLPNSDITAKSMVVFRVHHCVCDGIHLSRLLSSILAKGFSKGEYGKTADSGDAITRATQMAKLANVAPPAETYLGSLTQRMGKVLSLPSTAATVAYTFASNLVGGYLEAESPLNRPMAERSSDAMPYGGDRKMLVLPAHSVAYVKALKRVALTSFNAVVLSIATGAFRRYCDKADPEFQKKVEAAGGPSAFLARASTPMALEVSTADFVASQGLCNSFSVISTPIALGESTPAARLEATHNVFQSLRSSPAAAVTAWQEENLLHSLPEKVRRAEVLKFTAQHSFDFSSVPGPPMLGDMAGKEVSDISIVLPQMTSQLIILSYNGKLFPTLTYDPTLLPLAAESFHDLYLDELREVGQVFKMRGDPLTATDWEACMPAGDDEATPVN
jgi:hypothetical protein